MTTNIYCTCDICKTKFRFRWQVSELSVNIVVICPKCKTKIKGELKTQDEKIKSNFINASKYNIGDKFEKADYVLEVSAEFLCKKMEKDIGKIDYTPFIRNTDLILNVEQTQSLIYFAKNAEKYKEDIITAYNLYNNNQFEYLGKNLKNKNYEYINIIKSEIKSYRFVKQIDYLLGIHQYAVVLLSKTYTSGTFNKLNNIKDEIIKLSNKKHNEIINFIKILNDQGYYSNINIKFAKLIEEFLENYKNYLPLYLKKCEINFSLEQFGISTLDYEKMENFYKKAYEFLGDFIPIIIGLNNIAERNNVNNFKNDVEDFSIKINKFSSKFLLFEQCIIENEKFSKEFHNCINNVVRNSEAHFSTEYDAITQIITFKNINRGNEKICTKYLIEFGIEIINIFQKCIILWEYAYQLNKIYLFNVLKQKIAYKIK